MGVSAHAPECMYTAAVGTAVAPHGVALTLKHLHQLVDSTTSKLAQVLTPAVYSSTFCAVLRCMALHQSVLYNTVMCCTADMLHCVGGGTAGL